MSNIKSFNRKTELSKLKGFLESPKSGLVYVRGRRRIGKSYLLKEFKNKHNNVLYFTGVGDESQISTLKRFAKSWDEFIGEKHLSIIAAHSLGWSLVFKEINKYLVDKKKNTSIIIDEIQWISRVKSGFCGLLKEAWLDLEKSGLIKIIICGSSNKFFLNKTGGEEQILRGLQTHATIYVDSIPLKGVKDVFLRGWKNIEVLFTYMMVGGIPYYLQKINDEKGFIHGINDALFTDRSIFLEEINEILKLDFTNAGLVTIKEILSAISYYGASQKAIAKATGLSNSTINDAIEKLKDYGLIKEEKNILSKSDGTKLLYRMTDFYMNTYFQIIKKYEYAIKFNKKRLIFSENILSQRDGFYIENISGKAFELLIEHVLDKHFIYDLNIFNKLSLHDYNYKIEKYTDNEIEIDLMVTHNCDRITRIIECKFAQPDKRWIDKLIAKKPKNQTNEIKYFLACPFKATKDFLTYATEKQVTIIEIEDLF